MIQVTPQMRILVAVEPVDFRNYAERTVMQSADCVVLRVAPRISTASVDSA